MKFEDFITDGKIRKAQPDTQQAKSLLQMSEQNLKAIKEIRLTDSTASILFSQIYESLRQVIEAIAILKGFKVYSHEAYTYFLKELSEDVASQKFDRLRRLRNGIHYYGKPVSVAVTKNTLEEASQLSAELKEKYC